MSDPTTWPIPDLNAARGRLHPAQVRALLRPIDPGRVIEVDGHPATAGQDIKAHLTRIFGFGGWDYYSHAVLDYCEPSRMDGGATGHFDAVATGHVRLVIRNWDGLLVAVVDEENVAEAAAERGRARAIRLAKTSAITLALKRAAAALGDQFGLSLYNGGDLRPIVRKTLETELARHDGGGAEDGPETDLLEGTPPQLADEMPGADPDDPSEIARLRAFVAAQSSRDEAEPGATEHVERSEDEQRTLLLAELEWMGRQAPRLPVAIRTRLEGAEPAEVPVRDLADLLIPMRHMVVLQLRLRGHHVAADRYQARSDVAPLEELLACDPDSLIE
ncbi:Rad52/Rad22 family DNA repair protein [Nonomuraea sp. NPDC023979]|uniref:Rad52/Rad22 family DNA repair protein n=1 Tax=Nonomuraea sp. NPDC023979 TaxID=3154796 RepID=UPI0033E74C6C